MVLRDEQYEFLHFERSRTGLPVSELIRRAVDFAYMPEARRRVAGYEVNLGVWRDPDAAAIGRRLRPRWRRR